MKHSEKRVWWWYIVTNDKQFKFRERLEKSFFELDFMEIARLGSYADIFRIRPKNGKSPARYLWDEIKEQEPF